MAIRTYDILLDSYNSTIPEPIVGRQGDKNGAVTLHVTVADRGAAVNLTGQTINLMAETAKGTAIIADNGGVTITNAVGGKFDYAIPNALWSESGKITKAYFSLSDANGQQTTYDLIFIVKKAIDVSQKSADDYITIIDGTLKSLKEKINAIAVPETFTNLATIQSKYPNGSNGIMIAADNGHKYIWANSTWTDAGIYQAVGIADDSIKESQLDNQLKRKVNPQWVSLFRGTARVDFQAGIVTLIDFDFVLNNIKTHLTMSDEFNSSLNITDLKAGYLYAVVITVDQYKATAMSLVEFDQIADNQYILLTFCGDKVLATYSPLSVVEVRPAGGPAQFQWAAVTDYHAITIDKNLQSITTTPNFSIAAGDKLQFNVYVENTKTIDYSATIAANLNKQYWPLALVFDPVTKLLETYFWDEIPFGRYLLCLFKNNDNMFASFNDSAFVQIDKNNKYVTEKLMNVELGQFNDQGAVTIDLQQKKILFNGKNTVSNVDLSKIVVATIPPEPIDLTGLTGYLVYCLVVVGTDVKVYKYDEVPRGSLLIATFKPEQSVFNTFGPAGTIITIDPDGFNSGKIVLPVKVLPKLALAEKSYKNVGYIGRWVQRDDGLYTTNLGAYLWAQVSGATSVTVDFSSTSTAPNPPQIAIRIDDGDFTRCSIDEMPYKISVDKSSPHVLTIITAGNSDEDQVWNGVGIVFKSLTVDDGNVIPLEPAGRRIAFIGDSITAGCWVAGKTPSVDYRPEINYAALTARQLGATDIRVAYSSVGVIKQGAGGVPSGATFVQNVDAKTPAPISYGVDLVVINLGTNDGGTTDEFLAAMQETINAIKLQYAGAYVVIMVPFRQNYAEEIRNLGATNDIPVIETSTWNLTYTDGVHPDTAGSVKAANLLAEKLNSIFGVNYF